jgi:hypothetical protein
MQKLSHVMASSRNIGNKKETPKKRIDGNRRLLNL